MPNPTFARAIVGSSMGKGQKTAMLRKAQGKDKEVFTKNKKALTSVKQKSRGQKNLDRAKKMKADPKYK